MTKIKICGLKREEDVLYVNQLKPDYVGFVFAKSSRQVDKAQAKALIGKLDKNIKKVGVFLNSAVAEVKKVAKYCNLDILQFHGEEDPSYCNSFEIPIWKGFRIKDENSLKEIHNYQVEGFLLDAYVKGSYGGAGIVFNWDLVASIKKDRFIILAGGLELGNIKTAIEKVRPDVVDVSSGVETHGVKDFEKIKEFIEKVREKND